MSLDAFKNSLNKSLGIQDNEQDSNPGVNVEVKKVASSSGGLDTFKNALNSSLGIQPEQKPQEITATKVDLNEGASKKFYPEDIKPTVEPVSSVTVDINTGKTITNKPVIQKSLIERMAEATDQSFLGKLAGGLTTLVSSVSNGIVSTIQSLNDTSGIDNSIAFRSGMVDKNIQDKYIENQKINGKKENQIFTQLKKVNTILDDYSTSEASLSDKRSFVDRVKQDGVVSGVFDTVIETAPQAAAMIGAAIGTGGSALAPVMLGYLQEAGSMFSDMKKKGLDDNKAAEAAMAYGIPATIVENTLGIIPANLGKTLKQPIMNTAKSIISGLIGKDSLVGTSLSEGFEEVIQNSIQNIVSDVYTDKDIRKQIENILKNPQDKAAFINSLEQIKNIVTDQNLDSFIKGSLGAIAFKGGELGIRTNNEQKPQETQKNEPKVQEQKPAEQNQVFHGTSPENITIIKKEGFKSSEKGALGNGVYFTDSKQTQQTYGDNAVNIDTSKYNLIKIDTRQEATDLMTKAGVEDSIKNLGEAASKQGYDGFVYTNKDPEVGNTTVITNLEKLNSEVTATQKETKSKEQARTVNEEQALSGKSKMIASQQDYKVKTEEGVKSTVQRKEGEVVKRSQIIKDLKKSLEVPIREGRFKNPNAIGVFKTKPSVIRFKAGGASTIFHEIGHFIDQDISTLSLKINEEETQKLISEYGAKLKDRKTQRSEAFAEFLRFYLTGDQKAKSYAPKFYETFKKEMEKVPKETKDILEQSRDKFIAWSEQSDIEKVKSNISFAKEVKTEKPTIKEIKDKLYETIVDDMNELNKYVKTAQKESGKTYSAKENPYILSRLFRGWTGVAETFIEKGTFDAKDFYTTESGETKPKFIGKSFKEILKPIQDEGKLEDFSTYLVARRNQELASREIVTGIDKDVSDRALKALEDQNPNFKKAAEELDQYQTDVLNYAKTAGLLDQESFNKMKEANKMYVPFFRVQEELASSGNFGKGIADLQGTFKKIKGSEKEIIDPIEGIIKNTYSLINAAQKNMIMQAIANISEDSKTAGRLFEKIPNQLAKVTSVNPAEIFKSALDKQFGNFAVKTNEDLDNLTRIVDKLVGETVIDIFRPSFFNKNNEITILKDGKKQTYYVDSDLYSAIHGLNGETVNLIVKMFSYPARWVRAGATLAPEFIARNPIRDQFSAYMFSKFGFKPGFDMWRGLQTYLKQDENYWLWRMTGGTGATMVDIGREQMAERISDLNKPKSKVAIETIRNPLKLLETLSSATENATRLGEARLALMKGKDPYEAAFAAREVTLDFLRSGSKVKALSTLKAFWNANLQGIDKFAREAKENPKKVMFRGFVALTIPQILLYVATMLGDDKEKEEWDNIPDWEKRANFMFKIGNQWFKIPKPPLIGDIFCNIPLSMLEWMRKNDPAKFTKYITNFISDTFTPLNPMDLTIIQPLWENRSNYDAFFKRNIVPQNLLDMPAPDQYTDQTSEAAKLMGKLFNLSPAKIDNLISGWFATLGTASTQAIDQVMRTAGLIPQNLKRPPLQLQYRLPLLKAFVSQEPIGSRSQAVQDFYDKFDESKKVKNKFDQLSESGKPEAEKYFKDNMQLINLYDSYNDAYNRFRTYNNQKKVINSSDLSDSKKRELNAELDKIISTEAYNIINIKIK